MCGHVARVVLKNAKLKSEKLAREIAQMAEVYFDGMAGVDNKGLVRVNEIWTIGDISAKGPPTGTIWFSPS